MPIGKRAAAEFFGTFWLVFGGCGSAVLAAGVPHVGIGYAGRRPCLRPDGHDHGLRHRPYFGLPPEPGSQPRTGRRQALPASDLLPYVIAQVVGGIAAAGVLYVIASGICRIRRPRRIRLQRIRRPFSSGLFHAGRLRRRSRADRILSDRDHGRHRQPRSQRLRAHRHRPLPDSDSSGRHPGHESQCNPARSTGPAIFAGGWALQQLWMFWVAPLIGAALGGGIYRVLFSEEPEPTVRSAMTADARARN